MKLAYLKVLKFPRRQTESSISSGRKKIPAYECNLIRRNVRKGDPEGPNRVRIAVIAGLTILIIRDECAHSVYYAQSR